MSRRALPLAVLALLSLFILVPQLRVLVAAFTGPAGDPSLAPWQEFFGDARFREALLHSLWLALATGLGATLVAVPTAYLLARYEVPGRAWFLELATMTTASPPFLGAYAWVLLLGASGVVMRGLRAAGLGTPFRSIVGPGGIVWVGVWFTAASVVLILHDAFRAGDGSLEEAAAMAGASRRRTLTSITLPLALPAIGTGFYLAALQAFADFGTPKLIGGGYTTLPVALYYEFLSEVQRRPAMAAVACVLMAALSAAGLGFQRWLVSKTYPQPSTRQRVRLPLGPLARRLGVGFLSLSAFLSLVPHAVVVLTSFMTWRAGVLQWTPTLENYRRLWSESWAPIGVSLVLSGIGTAIAVALGAAAAYWIVRRRTPLLSALLNNLIMLPSVIPGTVLAIGLLLTFGAPPWALAGTATILVVAYVVRRLAYVTKAVETAMARVPVAQEEAAWASGATPPRAFFEIVLPQVRGALGAGAASGFLQMMTEVSATVMLYAVPWVTMTVVIFTYALQPGSPFGVASAMTTVLLVCIWVPLRLVSRHTTAREQRAP